jgi:hypothetical protein
VDGAGAEREVGAAAATMDQPGGPATREAVGRARAGAEAAMQAAAAVRHGGLAAAGARTRAGAAAWCLQVIAGRIAVPEPAAAHVGSSVELKLGRPRGGGGLGGQDGLTEGSKGGHAAPVEGGPRITLSETGEEAGHTRSFFLRAEVRRRRSGRPVAAQQALGCHRTLHHEIVGNAKILYKGSRADRIIHGGYHQCLQCVFIICSDVVFVKEYARFA